MVIVIYCHLVEGQHHEGPATAGVHDHGHKLGVHGAEVAVPGHLGDSDVIVALVSFRSLTEDVTELAGPHNLPGHGELGTKQKQRLRLQQNNKKSLLWSEICHLNEHHKTLCVNNIDLYFPRVLLCLFFFDFMWK